MIAPVRPGIAHWRALSCFCALATSGGVVGREAVPPATGTSPALIIFWPSIRE